MSGQNKEKSKPNRLEKFLEFYDQALDNTAVFEESGFAVEFLVKNFGKDKLLQLLKSLKKVSSKEEFERIFRSVYMFELDYRNFNY